jgi:hypothetical protein
MGTLVVIMLMVVIEKGLSAESLFEGFPTSDIPPSIRVEDGTFNLQIQAIEVTQGVRGEIPSRSTPHGDLALLPDGAVHIANRRTVVRVYPWVEDNSETTLPPLTARLWAYREGTLLPGSPISLHNASLDLISPDWDLATMRADSQKSWNFILPPVWTAIDTERGSFTLQFIVEVNPPGPDHQPECRGCSVDNQVTLGGQEFVTVPPMVIQPYFVEHTLTNLKEEQVTYPGPTLEEFETVMKYVHSNLPVGDLDRGLVLLPPIDVEWKGLLYENDAHIFAEAMISQYFPGGVLDSSEDGVIHLFVFSSIVEHWFMVKFTSDGVNLDLAWKSKPYAQGGAYGQSLLHELTHAIGLSHAGNMYGETTTNPDYPDPSGRVEPNAYGFDIWEMQAVPPVSERGETHDYMSYNSTDPAWVSIYTWKAIGNLLGQPGLDV